MGKGHGKKSRLPRKDQAQPILVHHGIGASGLLAFNLKSFLLLDKNETFRNNFLIIKKRKKHV